MKDNLALFNLRVPNLRAMWLSIARFAWKKAASGIAIEKMPVGIPGVRDPNYPCESYSPRLRINGEISYDFSCDSDGHYLCKECAFFNPHNPDFYDKDNDEDIV